MNKMREQTTMTVGIAIVLNEVSRLLLYKQKTNENGQPVLVDREIPFRLKYRLNKNRMMLETDVKRFNQSRMIALAKYGEQAPDGENVIITDPVKRQAFEKEISDLIDSQVTHPLNLLDPRDFEVINDTDMPISPEAMSIFTAYMVDDPDFQKDIELSVRFKDYKPPVQEEPVKTEEVKEEVKSVEEPKPVVEEVKIVEEEVKPAPKKKTTTKKSTTKKTEDKKVEKPKVEEPKPEIKKATKKTTSTKKTTVEKKVEEPKVETEPKKKTTTKKSTTTKKKKEEVNG